jgi:hypothetical protein
MTGGIDARLAHQLMSHENDMVKRGGEVLNQGPPPGEYSGRTCQDTLWGVAFILVAGGVSVLAVMDLGKLKNLDKTGETIADSIPATIVAGIVSALAAIVFLQMAQICPHAIVWTSLLLSPIMLVVGGAAMCLSPSLLPMGFVMILVGLLLGSCIVCCYRSLVPFTVLILETVVHVTKMHAGIMLVSIFGAMLSCVWVVAVFFAALAVLVRAKSGTHSNGDQDPTEYVFEFIFVLILSWGSFVCVNICHVACSGVFAKWYFGKDQTGSPVGSSLKMALTTSFGSICFGSFLVAFVRAMEAVARSIRNRAREDGNWVVCIIAACMQCIIQCIGDMMEWFNSFAYVQCAVHGFGFMDAARATYALCTVANIRAILVSSMVGWVAGLGCLFCALVGTCAALPFGNPVAVYLGFLLAMIVGGGALQVIDSGAKTIMVCWAENEGMLRQSRPELQEAFQQRSEIMSSR